MMLNQQLVQGGSVKEKSPILAEELSCRRVSPLCNDTPIVTMRARVRVLARRVRGVVQVPDWTSERRWSSLG